MRRLLILLLGLCAPSAFALQPLSIDATYGKWIDGAGNAIVLSGYDSAWTFQAPGNGAPTTNTLWSTVQFRNHRFVRLWQYDVPYNGWAFSPEPFARPGPGTAQDGSAKWDITAYNSAYFAWLSNNVSYANSLGVYVSVMLFDGYWVANATNQWTNSFYNPVNNVNGYSMAITDTYTTNNATWLGMADNYVKHTVDVLNGFDGLLWEVLNEPPYNNSKPFTDHMIALIKSYESGKPKQHFVGTAPWNPPPGGHMNTNTFAELTYQEGGDWLSVASSYVPALTNMQGQTTAPTFFDGDHTGTSVYGDFWKAFTRNYQPLLFIAQGDTNGMEITCRNIRKIVDRTRSYRTMVPDTSVASTAFALTNTIPEYLVYDPNNSAFTVALPAGQFNVTWMRCSDGTLEYPFVNSYSASAGNRTFTPPSWISGDSVLYLSPFSRPSGGLEFDGVDDTVISTSTLPSSGDLTISFWVWFYDLSGVMGIFDNGSLGIAFVPGAFNTHNNSMVVTSDASTHWAYTADNSFYTNGWFNVIITRSSAGVVNWYLNGFANGTANQSDGTPGAGSGNTNIGCRVAQTQYFKGLLRDFKVYNRILSATEISRLFNAKTASPISRYGLIAHWKLTGKDAASADGQTVQDLSGHGLNATVAKGANGTGVTWRSGAGGILSTCD